MDKENEIPSHLRGYPDWQRKPFRLNKYEIEYPGTVIARYHQIYPLPELRDLYNDIVWDAVHSEAPSGKDYLAFQQESEKFNEAVYLLLERGQLPKPENRQQSCDAFVSRFIREMDACALDITTLLDTITSRKDDQGKTNRGQTELALRKVKAMMWQMRSATDSLEQMLDAQDDSYSLSLVTTFQQTARLIDACVSPFNEYQEAFGKTLKVIKDAGTERSFATDKLKFIALLQNLLHVAILFCQEQGSVQLTCHSSDDRIRVVISFEGLVHDSQEPEPAAFGLFGQSAIAGTHIYCGRLLAKALGGEFFWHNRQGERCFIVGIPYNIRA